MKEKDIQQKKQFILNKLNLFYDIIQCTYNIDHWIYNVDGTLLETSSNDGYFLDNIFLLAGLKKYMIDFGEKNTKPLFLSSTLGNFWIVIFERIDDELTGYHVLGPVMTDVISTSNLHNLLKNYDIPLSFKNKLSNLVKMFPIIPWATLTQYVIMLHYIVNNEKIINSDFFYQTESKPETAYDHKAELDVSTKKDNLSSLVENELLNNIRTGNLNYQIALSNASAISSGVQINVRDPLRRAKISSAVFIALCARAAQEGGLPADSVHILQNAYTQSSEDAQSTSEVAHINHTMYEDFIKRVHKIKINPNISLVIRGCQDYIQRHATEKISIQDLAENYGYTTYYLSRRFKKETGISINEFICEVKITLAKNILSTTSNTIQEISDTLNFCSRSYFTDCFRKIVGISPTEYRQQYNKIM